MTSGGQSTKVNLLSVIDLTKFEIATGAELPRIKSRKRPKLASWVVLIPLTSIVMLVTISLIVDLRVSKYAQRRPATHNAPIVTHEADGDSEGEHHESGFLRLPKTIRPSYYTLRILPWLGPLDPHFEGTVTIFVTCIHPTTHISLHAHNLTISSTKVNEVRQISQFSAQTKMVEIVVENTKVEESKNFFVISLKEKLETGKDYQVTMDFKGRMGEDLTGFYQSSYLEGASNSTKYVGLTQFEPTAARKAFPCFDEPQLKAIFQINIGRTKGMRSISNTQLQRTRPHETLEDWSWDEYEPTLPMSTYLLAFVISEFEYQETTFGSSEAGVKAQNKTFRVWSRSDVLNQTNYAFTIAPKLLDYFQNYFQVPYPLEKMDFVAVPEFQNGGMENWGLVIFKETEMLFNPLVTSKSVQNTIASTISHEISHQWFGDLVTPHWWSDIWLNEGFASYFEYVGVSYVEPTWQKMELLLIDEMEDVMDTDVLDFTRPISIPVEDPDDIEEQFDGISYAKGASTIAMISAFLTPETFRNGLREYLLRWKYNNPHPSDLWHQFTIQAHKDERISSDVTVADIMSTWTLQKGFPLIQVTRDYDSQTARFAQSKYTLIRKGKKIIRRWWVPISYASPRHNSKFNDTVPVFWIAPTEDLVEVDVPSQEYDWLIVNVNATGYFRVNYDMRNWQLLANQLKSDPNAISVLNRAQLLDDCLSFGRSSMLPYAFVLSLVDYLRLRETQFTPWQAFLNGLQHIFNMLLRTPTFTYFQSYVRRLIQFEFSKISFNRSQEEVVPFLTSLHEQSVLLWAISANHPEAVQRARQYFQNSVQAGKSTVPPNFRKPIYCSIVESGGEAEWNFIWSRYLDGNWSPGEMKILIQALACSTDPSNLAKLINMALQPDSDIGEEHALLVLKEVAINPLGTDLVFKLLSSNWTELQNYLSDLSVVVTVIGDQHNRPEQLRDWLLFKGRFGSELGPAQRSVYQTIEKIRSNIEWMTINYKSISNLFKEYLKIF